MEEKNVEVHEKKTPIQELHIPYLFSGLFFFYPVIITFHNKTHNFT